MVVSALHKDTVEVAPLTLAATRDQRRRFIIGANVVVYDTEMTIGDDVFISSGCFLDAGYGIEIGDRHTSQCRWSSALRLTRSARAPDALDYRRVAPISVGTGA
jgi:acetyltransferase-like isoleucine patch superfamily enzyme